MAMLAYQQETVRRNGIFDSPVCEGNHPLHLCPLMDKASAVLESLTASSPQLPIGYQRLSSDPPSIDKEIDLDSSFFCPPPSKIGCAKSVPNTIGQGECQIRFTTC